MTDNTNTDLDSDALRPGDHVEILGNEHLHYNAYVEDTLPQFNIAWVREQRTGERKMLFTNECRILRRET
ncbi:hypothetical protein [Arthrobacter crystallopoietes]|uniref:DUF1918 domain-containing protein n=1 Tax=Crystallibacter crystallopoietes TaxID=37928 RepID=A0A1H1HX89_9MICC|nr:hypothetical protein [Arthrobacter crystallopoietes]AUI53820.1 hypothetical protein AC20117_23075 [Arthrobacter crystallopoietes]SDR29899.1 hypothetical protein SAMN04489742_4744 [Arthrobacter crystallopoietes]